MSIFQINSLVDRSDAFVQKYLSFTDANTLPTAKKVLADRLFQKTIYPRVWRIDNYIVKMNDPEDKRDDVVHEAFVGLTLNQMKSSHFVQTIGAFRHKQNNYIVVKFISGTPLRKYPMDFTDLVRTCIYTIFVLKVAYERYGFTHYDLHGGNVLIQQTSSPVLVRSPWGNFYSRIHPVIIDLGRSHIQLNGVHYGRTVNRQAASPTPKQGYDYYFLLQRMIIRHYPNHPDTIRLKGCFDLRLSGVKLFRDLRRFDWETFDWDRFHYTILTLESTRNWFLNGE